MSKKQRITELEQRLVAAEARLAELEQRPAGCGCGGWLQPWPYYGRPWWGVNPPPIYDGYSLLLTTTTGQAAIYVGDADTDVAGTDVDIGSTLAVRMCPTTETLTSWRTDCS